MAIRHRLLDRVRGDADGDGGGEGGGEDTRPTPAEINAEQNNRRLSRIEQIARSAEGRRAEDMSDVNGENVTGRFAEGELDDSPEARERRAQEEQDAAEAALREEAERAAAEEGEDAAERARRLQEEGGDGEDGADGGAGDEGHQAGDEKVINGVKHYLTIVSGQERWLTLPQLREQAMRNAATEEALQNAQAALQRSTHAALSPKDEPAELDEAELKNVVLSAVMGDTEAVDRLVSVIKSKPRGEAPDVSRLVSQQIATQRAIDTAEAEQQELLSNANLAPVFRMRLAQFAQAKPNTKIEDAYRQVGAGMRKDFAAMLGNSRPPANKQDRKRTIVTPPQGAGRQPAREREDQEVPLSTQIDEIARGRGQQRAIRQSRR